jgi:hypothetical protein
MPGILECVLSFVWAAFFLPVGAQMVSMLAPPLGLCTPAAVSGSSTLSALFGGSGGGSSTISATSGGQTATVDISGLSSLISSSLGSLSTAGAAPAARRLLAVGGRRALAQMSISMAPIAQMAIQMCASSAVMVLGGFLG